MNLSLVANTSSITCCTDDGQHQDEKSRHPHCIALDIPIDDPFYGQHNVRCINMVRSQVAPRSTCNFGYAHQLNSVMFIFFYAIMTKLLLIGKF